MFAFVRTTTFVLAIVAAAGACKRDLPAKQEPPANVATPSSPTGSAGGGGMLALPHGPGTPPLKTAGPLDRATLEKIGEQTFPKFQRKPHGQSDTVVEVRQITEDFPRIMATITIENCNKKERPYLPPCHPMQLDQWKDEPRLKELLLDELQHLSDTVWETGMTDVAGAQVFYTYQLAVAPIVGGHGAISHAYALYYNDGTNQIRVVAQFADDPVDRETMVKKVPREDLTLVAKAFLDVYTHAWASS
jgi:hypothetical protein